MSIRTNPNKAVALLLRRLMTTEKDGYLDDLKLELVKVKDLVSTVKKNQEEFLDTLTIVDNYLRNFNISKLMQEKEDICQRIRNSSQKLLPEGSPQTKTQVVESSSNRFQYVEPGKRENMHQPLSSSHLQDLETFKVRYDSLDIVSKRCLLSLLVFHENVVVKKMHVIYWWIGVGFLEKKKLQIAENQGEKIFAYLRKCELIVPYGKAKSPIVNRFKINHWFGDKLPKDDHAYEIYSHIRASSQYEDARHDCLALDLHKVKLNDEASFISNRWRAVFNIDASYLTIEPQWIAKMKNLEVFHLGRWQDSALHHIEVKNEEFLKEFRNKKHLKYINIRGISRISKLPPSIFQLESLEILDFKACHNLETIPHDIASLKNLRYLNMSQCYLLESMPRGIEKLTKLQVLKGFVIGNSSKTPCRISDLANLKELERLSIHIGSEVVILNEAFESLEKLLALRSLKVSWDVSSIRYNDIRIILPSTLKKLHLEGFPGKRIPEFLTKIEHEWHAFAFAVPKVTMLYMTGGKIETLDSHVKTSNWWYVQIVRLKHLKRLKVDSTNLRMVFPSLMYAEIKDILNHSYFEWRPKDKA